MGQCWYNRVEQEPDNIERIPSSQSCITRTDSATSMDSEGTANSFFSTKIYHTPSRIIRPHNQLPHITELKNSVSVEDTAGQTYMEYPLRKLE